MEEKYEEGFPCTVVSCRKMNAEELAGRTFTIIGDRWGNTYLKAEDKDRYFLVPVLPGLHIVTNPADVFIVGISSPAWGRGDIIYYRASHRARAIGEVLNLD